MLAAGAPPIDRQIARFGGHLLLLLQAIRPRLVSILPRVGDPEAAAHSGIHSLGSAKQGSLVVALALYPPARRYATGVARPRLQNAEGHSHGELGSQEDHTPGRTRTWGVGDPAFSSHSGATRRISVTSWGFSWGVPMPTDD